MDGLISNTKAKPEESKDKGLVEDVISVSVANACTDNKRAMLEIEDMESELSASEKIDVYDKASEMVGKIDQNERIKYGREILLRLESLPQSRMKVDIEIPGVAKGDLRETGLRRALNPSIAKKTSNKVKQLFSEDNSKNFKRDRTQSEPTLNTDIVDRMNGMKIDSGTVCMSPSNISTVHSIQSMESQLRKAISDWNTVHSNESSRFQVKKSELVSEDVVELRENGLPPSNSNSGPGMDQRGPSGRQQSTLGTQQQKKISDWNTVQSNKSSRFQVKKSDQPGMPVLAPSGGTWGRGQDQVPINTSIQSSNLPTTPKQFIPPRFNRFNGCEPSNALKTCGGLDRDQQQEPTDASSDSFSTPHSSKRTIAPRLERFLELAKKNGCRPNVNIPNQQSMSVVPNPVNEQNMHPSLANFISGNSNATFNGENPHSLGGEINAIDVRETVKDFIDGLQERKKNGKLNESVFWIRSHFKGDNIYIFIEELSRQICCKSDEFHQNEAGALVRLLLKYEFVNLDAIIKAMVKGFVKDLPDILIHEPKAIVNVATYLSEIFFEEDNTGWKIQLVSSLVFSTNHTSIGMRLIQTIEEFIRMRQECKKNIASNTTMTFNEILLK